MTEPITDPATADGQGDATEPQESTYSAPASQADLDRIITDRVNRTKAQFKDYNELKSKAAELDQLKQASQTEAERQAAELTRWQSEAEKWRGDAISNRIIALAADFADPSDAATALDAASYLDAGGQINEEAIKTDLAAVLDRKPHWRRTDNTAPVTRLPAPNAAQGSGGNAATDPGTAFGSIIQGLAQRGT